MEIALIFVIDGTEVTRDFKETEPIINIYCRINYKRGVYTQRISFDGVELMDLGGMTLIHDTELTQHSRLFCETRNTREQIKDFEEYKDLVETNPYDLVYVNHQSEAICEIAVSRNGWMIEKVHDKTEKLCVIAVETTPEALEIIENQTYKICAKALVHGGSRKRIFELVKHQNEKLCAIAIYMNPDNFKLVRRQKRFLCTLAVRLKPVLIDFVEKPGLKICVLAAMFDVNILEKVEKQHPDLCKEVIKRCPSKINSVRDPKLRSELEEFFADPATDKRPFKVDFDGHNEIKKLVEFIRRVR